MSDRDIATALRRANPVPHSADAVSAAQRDTLFASIERRRQEMTLTNERTENRRASPVLDRRPWYRRSAVLAAAALAVLVAVPAVAVLWDDDTPQLERFFPAGIADMAVYGDAAGIGEGCAKRMSFGPDGHPVIAGDCGVMGFDGADWHIVNADVETSGLQDIAVDRGGAVWMASVDDGVLQVTNDDVVNHPTGPTPAVKARTIAVAPDGTVWATRYDPDELPALISYDGASWNVHDVGPVDEVMVGSDGTVWTVAWVPFEYDDETKAAESWTVMVGRFVDGEYLTELIPQDGEYGYVAPDGAFWAVAETSDTASDLLRFDGTTWSTLHAPIAQINDLAVEPDGTVWVTSHIYGAFAHDGADWVRYGTADGLPEGEVTFVEVAPNGEVWVGTWQGIARLVPETR